MARMKIKETTKLTCEVFAPTNSNISNSLSAGKAIPPSPPSSVGTIVPDSVGDPTDHQSDCSTDSETAKYFSDAFDLALAKSEASFKGTMPN